QTKLETVSGEPLRSQSIEPTQLQEVSAAIMQTRSTRKSRVLIALMSLLVLLVLSTPTRSQDPIETIRIDSELVDLKVSVLGFSANATAPLLEQKDFLVLEDGKQQEI